MSSAPAEPDRTCAILEALAQQHPPESAEHQALRDAAAAYILVRQSAALEAAWRRLQASVGAELTPEMITRLRALGIDPAV